MTPRAFSRTLHGSLLCLAACSSSPDPRVTDDCRRLVAATPDTWPEHWQRVHARGPTAAPALVAALRANPGGAGVQAGVQLLGIFRTSGCRHYLEEILAANTPLGAEAALALGQLGDKSSISVLQATVRNRESLVTNRVAAAAALIDLDAARSVASFLEAVFLAAGPDAAGPAREHGLPRRKSRWAYERYMVIQALDRKFGTTFGLDEDASWPALKQAAAKMHATITQ